MALHYESWEEAQDRINNTVIFYNEEPVYIRRIIPDGRHVAVEFLKLPVTDTHPITVSMKDPNLRAFDIMLGYFNLPNVPPEAWYVVRSPMRQWRQGLTAGIINLPRKLDFNSALRSIEFKAMLMGRYPSLNQARNIIDEHRIGSVAFNRRFALERTKGGNYSIEYRGHHVALSLDGKKFKLDPKHAYLQEQCEELGMKTYLDREDE